MHAKFLLLAVLLGGLTIFFGGALSHTALALPGARYPLKDAAAVIDAIRAQAPANGVYYDSRGLLAVVALRPAFLLARSRAKSVFERAHLTGLMGLASLVLGWLMKKMRVEAQ